MIVIYGELYIYFDIMSPNCSSLRPFYFHSWDLQAYQYWQHWTHQVKEEKTVKSKVEKQTSMSTEQEKYDCAIYGVTSWFNFDLLYLP